MKIVFLCHFSNPLVREKLDLRKYTLRRLLYNLKGGAIMYDDFAVWVSDYIAEFEKHPEVEFHIVAPHYGMKREIQSYDLRNIHYHFFRWNYGIIYTALDKLFHLEEKNLFARNRGKMNAIIGEINPDLIILCGAENPYYSVGVLDVTDKPVYVILQTLLNDPKRIEMGVGSPYRREVELRIFKHAGYFCTSGKNVTEKIKERNPNAKILPAGFPTHRENIVLPTYKEYDFVFFAQKITKNKGIEDLLKALGKVAQYHKTVKLNVIGNCDADYKKYLETITKEQDIVNNVSFAGYYQKIDDAFNEVIKAKAVVVPGITAGLNSTVRESMLMGLPTI